MAEHAEGFTPNRYDADMDASRPRKVRVTVSLSPERLERARKRVEWGKIPSVSAWVEEALIHHEGQFGWDPNALRELLDELDRIYGPVPEDPERDAWVERVLNYAQNGP
jgi:hypothetical protein